MFNLGEIVSNSIKDFFANIIEDIISFFATELANLMSTSIDVLQLPLVQNGIQYSQALAFTILILKTMNEAFQTYIIYQNGDPDSDPSGLLIRTAQAVAVIATLPWIVTQIFTFGSKLALDVAGLSTGQTGIADWKFMIDMIILSKGTVVILMCIVIIIMFLIVGIQATIRGAELALTAVLGPIMALNITANNRSVWSAWFRQVVIVCCTQAIQIFLLQGAFALLTSQSITSGGLIKVFGWLWITIKSPKFIQQFFHSTGFSGAVGGTAKQTGSMYLMRRMLAK
ncbi:MAG: conjugal transfer protein TrbL family protein [Clostridia bacterium]